MTFVIAAVVFVWATPKLPKPVTKSEERFACATCQSVRFIKGRQVFGIPFYRSASLRARGPIAVDHTHDWQMFSQTWTNSAGEEWVACFRPKTEPGTVLAPP
jgi:hypothetical protein